MKGIRLLNQIQEILATKSGRKKRAERLSRVIRDFCSYRWVGFYQVGAEEISVIAWSGPSRPSHPRFPATRGLCGAAAASGSTVIVGDVTKDPRYITTFGSTRSEMIVPIRHPETKEVLGLIDVDSERLDAFSDEDRRLLEMCAAKIAPHWF